MSVRVRFAPSPTGNVHIGNIRAAIFNWLYARHHGGRFLLRIEDTDRERSTTAAIQTLLECMAWLQLDFDEEPLYQSRQTERHLAVAADLLQRGFAYRDNKGGTEPCTVFRMPTDGHLEFNDLVKGTLRKNAADSPDFVIVRSDGTPVFHLANVVDDIDMGITHIIRGDDHVENTFRHIELFRAIGATPPQYAHLPMIVNNQGKPYSKRDGTAFVGEFKERGFLPQALFNYLALLGWAPGDDREVMSRAEMVDAFSFERCKASAARFDLKKLIWMNGEYIRQTPREIYRQEFATRLQEANLLAPDFDPTTLEGIITQMQVRTKFYNEIPANCAYFFTEEYPFDPKAVEKRLQQPDTAELLLAVAAEFAQLPTFNEETTHEALAKMGASRGTGLGGMVHPVRVAVSGSSEGPGLFELLTLLGREVVCARLRRVAATVATPPPTNSSSLGERAKQST